MLIIHLTLLLIKDCEENKILSYLYPCQDANKPKNISNINKQDLLHILAITIYQTKAEYLSNFSVIFYFNVKEPTTYKQE